jgi:hypothetical protein
METMGNKKQWISFCDDPIFKKDLISGNTYCTHCWIKKEDHFVTAKFIGWQVLDKEFERRGMRSFKLYNIIGGPRNGTTVGTATLKRMGIEVPKAPTLKEWRKTHED